MSSEDNHQMGEPSVPITDSESDVNLQTKLSIINGAESVDSSEDTVIINGYTYRVLESKDYIGIDSLSEQFFNRLEREGFGFNVMVLGETGIGKTSLLYSLFDMKSEDLSPESHNSSPEVMVNTYDLQERNIRLKLSVIESKGFGDQMNKDESYKPFVEYIDQQFERHLQEELKIDRNLSPLNDSRVHVCLYMVSPVGHGLKAIDLVTMKKLDSKTNLVPVIAKSDTITRQELKQLKDKIMSEIVDNGINIYHFPNDEEEAAKLDSTNNSLMPFAIVGSHDFVRVGSKAMRGRQYPWGTVQVENESHCDFVRLRDMMLRDNMEDLRETTHSRHYELYRRLRLEQTGFHTEQEQKTYSQILAIHRSEMERTEQELRQRFALRVKQKEVELNKAAEEMYQKFNRMNGQLTDEVKQLEIETKRLDDQISAFNFRKAGFYAAQGSSNQSLSGKNKKK